jgi:DNA-binding NarL/FixJ family response regulator
MIAPPSRAVRVLVVDDHPMVREGLRSMLDDGTVEVVSAVGTGAEAIRLADGAEVDVILLDLELPDVDGLTVLTRVRQLAPRARVLVVTMHDEPLLVRRAMAAGAAGYLLKGVGRGQLLAAVHAAHRGEAPPGPALSRGPAPPYLSPAPRPPADTLTRVEREVLQLIADGLTNRQISQRLHWSVGTTKKYVQRILGKLAVADRTQAAAVAVRLRLVP